MACQRNCVVTMVENSIIQNCKIWLKTWTSLWKPHQLTVLLAMGFWRDNAVLTETLLKVRHEYKLDWETSLGWAINAKNSLQSVHGFSPFQLVFGRNPNLPNILEDKPPALEGTTSSEVVAKQITALHAAIKAFIESESSEHIWRVLRKKHSTIWSKFWKWR